MCTVSVLSVCVMLVSPVCACLSQTWPSPSSGVCRRVGGSWWCSVEHACVSRAYRSWSMGCVCTCMVRVVLRSSRCAGGAHSGHRAVASSPNCAGVQSACTGTAHNPNTSPHASGNNCGLHSRSGHLRSAGDSSTARRHTPTWQRWRCSTHTLTCT